MLSSNSIIKIVILLLISSTIQASIFLDNDLDGVSNEDDKCPNSEITDIVDKYGCKVEQVSFEEKETHIDVSITSNYDKIGNSWQNSQNLSIGYYYKNSSFWLSASKYSVENNDDLTLSYYYYINNSSYNITLGAGAYIPLNSNDNDNTDYFLSAKYAYIFNRNTFSIKYLHTFFRDSNTQDTNLLQAEYGYLFKDKIYTSISYEIESSLYKNQSNSQRLGIYTNFYINDNWYLSTNIKKELTNSSDYSASFTLGYYY